MPAREVFIMMYLCRDNEIILSATNETAEIDFTEYIHKNHSYSLAWAIKVEGYKILKEIEL